MKKAAPTTPAPTTAVTASVRRFSRRRLNFSLAFVADLGVGLLSYTGKCIRTSFILSIFSTMTTLSLVVLRICAGSSGNVDPYTCDTIRDLEVEWVSWSHVLTRSSCRSRRIAAARLCILFQGRSPLPISGAYRRILPKWTSRRSNNDNYHVHR